MYQQVGVKEISLTQGQVALVDDEDYAVLVLHKWHAVWHPGRRMFYASRGALQRGSRILMHREITSAPPASPVDHRDHNGLNNQRENLRICTSTQNNANKRKARSAKGSRYKGVSRHKTRFKAQCGPRSTNRHVGVFDTEEEAALAYNEAAKRIYGEFAWLNDVKSKDEFGV